MIRFGHWRFNPENGVIESNEQSHRLPPRLVKLLVLLTQNAPNLVEKESLVAEIWQDKIVNDDALARAIAELRRLLGDSSQTPTFIETVPRRGYRFIQTVESGERTAKPSPKVRHIFAILSVCIVAIGAFLWVPSKPSRDSFNDWQAKVNNAERFTADAQLEYQPELSPSGKWVAYGAKDEQGIIVKILDADGREKFRIEEPGAWVLSPTWSPDESAIAVAIATSEECRVILVALPELSRQYINHCSIPNGSGILDWSGDGKRIAFVARIQSEDSQPSIMLHDLASGEITRITTPPASNVFDTRPRFSVDGDALFFLRGTRSSRDIYRIKLSDGQAERMTDSNDFKLSLARSPFRDEIVFDSNSKGDRNLWLLSLADFSVKNIGARDSQFPSVSALGQLLFQEVRYQANLWAFDLNSGESKLLIDSPKYDNNPAISPDSSLLAYISNRYGRAEIWLKTLPDGEDLRFFSLPDTNLVSPVWSASGDTLLMSSHGNDGYGCYELRLQNKEVVKIDGRDDAIHNCHYAADDSVLAVRKTENTVPVLLKIDSQQVTELTDYGVNKAIVLPDGRIVLTQTNTTGLHILDWENLTIETLIADYPNQRSGSWTVADNKVYYMHPQHSGEFWSLDMSTSHQEKLLDGLDVGIGNAIAVSPDKATAVISLKGQTQSTLFISSDNNDD